MCALILRHTALLPHVNAGVVSKAEVAALRDVSVSAGLMLETGSAAVLQPGSAHYDCPDKILDKRLKVIRDAGGTFPFFLVQTLIPPVSRWFC